MPYTFFFTDFWKFGELIKNPQITDVRNVLKGKKNLDNLANWLISWTISVCCQSLQTSQLKRPDVPRHELDFFPHTVDLYIQLGNSSFSSLRTWYWDVAVSVAAEPVVFWMQSSGSDFLKYIQVNLHSNGRYLTVWVQFQAEAASVKWEAGPRRAADVSGDKSVDNFLQIAQG